MEILLTRPDGAETTLSCQPGVTLMEALRDGGVPMRAECGGACACATCHVHVAEEWQKQAGVASDEETDLLEDSDYFIDGTSRLSCQIKLTDAHDGLAVTLQLDAFEG